MLFDSEPECCDDCLYKVVSTYGPPSGRCEELDLKTSMVNSYSNYM